MKHERRWNLAAHIDGDGFFASPVPQNATLSRPAMKLRRVIMFGRAIWNE